MEAKLGNDNHFQPLVQIYLMQGKSHWHVANPNYSIEFADETLIKFILTSFA